jgi:hypothetical protein
VAAGALAPPEVSKLLDVPVQIESDLEHGRRLSPPLSLTACTSASTK